MSRPRRLVIAWLGLAGLCLTMAPAPARAAVTREEVERAIREGVRYLKQHQRADGSWPEIDIEANRGTTALITLALITAGEPANSPTIARAVDFLRQFGPE